MNVRVAPSILSADFACLGRQVAELEDAGAGILHIDVMDGHFVPNISMGPHVIKALRRQSKMFFDVHLMIENPERYIDVFAEAGADHLTVHWESTQHMHRLIQQIKTADLQAGIALNPATPFGVLSCIAHELDMVLVMSVNPGFGGQVFIPEALEKVAEAVRWRKEKKAGYRVEVDGGINRETAGQSVQAGAQIVVAGAAVFGSSRPVEAWRRLQGICEREADQPEERDADQPE